MEYQKLWAPIIVLAFVVAGAFCFNYFDKVDVANTDYQNAKLITSQAQDGIVARRQLMEARGKQALQQQTLFKRVQDAETRIKTAEQKKQGAENKQRAIEGDLKYWLGALPAVRQKAWDAAATLSLAELRLENGKVLANPKIRKVDDGNVSVLHTEGIATVASADLPPDLQERLDLGEKSILKQLTALQANLVETKDAHASPPVSSAPSSSSTQMRAELVTKNAEKLKALKFRRADLQSKLSAAQQSVQNWRAYLIKMSDQISNNQNRGVPTSKLREEYQKATGQAAVAQQTVDMIQADLNKNQVEIDTTQANP